MQAIMVQVRPTPPQQCTAAEAAWPLLGRCGSCGLFDVKDQELTGIIQI